MSVEKGSSRKGFRALKITAVLVFLLLLSFVSIAIGMRSVANQDALFFSVKEIKRMFVPAINKAVPDPFLLNEYDQLSFFHDKQEVDAPLITRNTVVAFVFGQSNAANHGGERHQSTTGKVFNYFEGKYYLAADPLLGATGVSGSVWSNLGDKLVNDHLADDVVLIPAGVGGSTLKQWQSGGRLNEMLKARLAEVKASGLIVTHFLWHQGESDNTLSPDEYSVGLGQVISLTKEYFPESNFFVAQASRCGTMASAPGILEAQRNATRQAGVYLGPNTDVIGLNDRYDDCHLSGRGIETHAKGWLESLKQPSSI